MLHALFEDRGCLSRAIMCVARANLFSQLVYPNRHTCLDFNFGPLTFNYFKLIKFYFIFKTEH